MIKPLVAGNWKMHGSRDFTQALTKEILEVGKLLFEKTDIALFPPSVYLPDVVAIAKNSELGFGLQNVATAAQGAYTGEIAAEMAQDFGCHYSLVGHSERRTLFNETNDQIAKKCLRLTDLGLQAILCVGETLAEKEQGITESVIKDQINSVIQSLNLAQIKHLIIAYEPVWAIGTGKTATPEQAQSVHSYIRQTVAAIYPEVASTLRILYGGSVKPENAQALFSQPDINGGLVGGASLDARAFLAICEATG